ncbi:MAG: (2Fe-2S) ferredoxin domain-containing protein [Bacteroidota bacterium]
MKTITELTNLKQGHDAITQDRIIVCLATCGISAGAKETLEALRQANPKIPVDVAGCIGMCYAEPIVIVKQDGISSIYHHLTADKVPKLLESITKKEVYS